MAITTKLGDIETRIRRDLVNDNEPEDYRWRPLQVLSRIRKEILEIAFKINPWAAYDQSTGRRIYDIEAKLAPVKAGCDDSPVQQAQHDEDPELVETLRAVVMPIDDRYAEAVAHLAAADLLETDNSDTINAETANRFRAFGREVAAK